MKILRRFALAAVLMVALLAGGNAALAKKHHHKKPAKIAVGAYNGMTTPDGLTISVTLNPGRTTGSVTYCQITAPIIISGTGFQVYYMEPASGDSIQGGGIFSAKKKSASGNVAPNGCTSVPQTFSLFH